jgi:uncharacterized membrane protein YqjE
MSLGIRLFIGFIFTLIGLSFLATTGTLVWEFWDNQRWLTLASFYHASPFSSGQRWVS